MPQTPSAERDTELAFLGLEAQMLSTGEVSSRELVGLCLRRIDEWTLPAGGR